MSALGEKPFAPSCERNRDPILAVLQRHFGGVRRVLEVASGTGQHAVHFAAAMPWLEASRVAMYGAGEAPRMPARLNASEAPV